MLCRRSLDAEIAVATYDSNAATVTKAPIKQCGRSSTKTYMRIVIENCTTTIVCTPIQEFYLATAQQWIPAYQLYVGDTLLCKFGTKAITRIEYIEESTDVYMLEISDTHTFFVGWHGALTHNMGLPAAVGLGFSIPFGSAAGSTAGAFFGPVTVVIGAALGAAIGAFVSMIQNDSVPSYKINLGNERYIQDFIKQQNSGEGSDNNAISNDSATFFNPMPNGPKKDADKNKTARMPDKSNKQKMNHIFKTTPGHREFSQMLYDAMTEMVNDAVNHLGSDQYGKQWFSKTLENGEQMWAVAQNGEVTSAGINQLPKPYNSITGLR
jgi:hypothetical protein